MISCKIKNSEWGVIVENTCIHTTIQGNTSVCNFNLKNVLIRCIYKLLGIFKSCYRCSPTYLKNTRNDSL